MTFDTGSAPKEANAQRSLKWAGYLIAAAGLAWVFYDLHPQHLLAAIKIDHWIWVLPAVFFDCLTYWLQGLRWSLLLAHVGHFRPIRATQAIYVGLFANEVLPLRAGELLRAVLVSRWMSVSIKTVLPSLVVERFLDALWLAVGIGVTAILMPLPRDLLEAGDVLGGLVLIAAALFLWIVLRKEKRLEKGEQQGTVRRSLFARASAAVETLATGLRDIGLSRRTYLATLLSAAMLICQALAVWFMILAYGLQLSVIAGVAVLLIVRLGTAIPNAPANVGSFQFFTVLALGIFGVEKTTAAGFSIVDFAVLTLPLWLLGFLSVVMSGFSAASLRAQVGKLRTITTSE